MANVIFLHSCFRIIWRVSLSYELITLQWKIRPHLYETTHNYKMPRFGMPTSRAPSFLCEKNDLHSLYSIFSSIYLFPAFVALTLTCMRSLLNFCRLVLPLNVNIQVYCLTLHPLMDFFIQFLFYFFCLCFLTLLYVFPLDICPLPFLFLSVIFTRWLYSLIHIISVSFQHLLPTFPVACISFYMTVRYHRLPWIRPQPLLWFSPFLYRRITFSHVQFNILPRRGKQHVPPKHVYQTAPCHIQDDIS
jgi:hypothetical protein